MVCSIAGVFRLQSSKTACIGTESGLGQLPELRSTRGGVAGLEQRGVGWPRAPVAPAVGGRRRPGAPLWCGCCSSLTPVLGAAALESTKCTSLGFVPVRGGVAGHEQSGAWSSTTAPVGSWGLGPSEARCAPLVRLLLLSDPGSWCSGTGRGLGQLPGLFRARRRRAWAAGRGAAREPQEPPWAAQKGGNGP